MEFDGEAIRKALAKTWNLEVQPSSNPDPPYGPSYNVCPTNSGAVYSAETHQLDYMKWGLIPHWVRDPKKFKSYSTFNARLDKLKSSKIWSYCLAKHRCAVPISGYYEWKTVNKDKIPYYVTRRDGKEMFLAGMFDNNPENELYTYTIVTGRAPKELEWLHQRMPVVIEPGTISWNTWMDTSKEEWSVEELEEIMKPTYNDEILVSYQVSKDVSKVKNKGEHLNKPIYKKDQNIKIKQDIVSTPASPENDHIKKEEEDISVKLDDRTSNGSDSEIQNNNNANSEVSNSRNYIVKESQDCIKKENDDSRPRTIKVEDTDNIAVEKHQHKGDSSRVSRKRNITDMLRSSRVKSQK